MDDDCRIRPTAPADLPVLARLEESAFSDPWTPEMLAEALAASGAVALVAERDGEVIGSVIGRRVADEGEILTIAVDPAHRRRGLGGRLLGAASDRLATAGARTLWLEVRPSNLPARRMYQAAGFVAAGLRRGYYRRPNEDALVLKRELAASPGTIVP